MIQPLYDYIYFKTDKILEDEAEMSDGTKIFVDTRFEEYKHAKIYGEVIAVPLKLSGHRLYYQNDIEQADYGRHVSHEDLRRKELNGHEVNRGMYRCFGYTPKFITRNHIQMDIKIGDTVYFHYDQIKNKSNHKFDIEGFSVFQVPIDKVLCVVRDGVIIPQGEWLLIDPEMQSEEEIMSPSGIQMQSEVKAKHLLGKVAHVGKPLKGYIQELSPGDDIIYMEESDWEVEIEGKKYFVMKHRDILAKKE
jgi:co-chaperonin GroES (HSP10)